METWDLIATERSRLVEALAALTEQEWAAPSLCAGWDSTDVLAHLVSTAELTPARFARGLVTSRMSFDRMVARHVAALRPEGPHRLLDRLRADVDRRDHPPGPTGSWLLETVVHGEDIAFAVGRRIDHAPEALAAAADFGRTAQPLVGCRKRVAGLRLAGEDPRWTAGVGPEVRGPLRALLLAMAGRAAALPHLEGPGVDVLRGRIPAAAR